MAYAYRLQQKPHTHTKKQILAIQESNELELAMGTQEFLEVRFLNMKNSNVNDETLVCLTKVDKESKLQKIDCSENFSFITDSTILNLSKCRGLTKLISLNLADNNITNEGIKIMASSEIFSKLRQLVLYGNTQIGSEGMFSLANSEWIKSIDSLDLHATSVSDEGMIQYLLGQNSSCLENLNLSMSWNRITDRTVAAIAQSRFCCKLTKLNLEDCNITDQGVILLCTSENSTQLQDLNLSNSVGKQNNIISDVSLKEMSGSKTIRNLRVLNLKATLITSQGIKTLATSTVFQRLQLLRLSHCHDIDEAILPIIGQMLLYSNLTKLHINNTSISRDQAVKFQQRYPKLMTIY